MKQQKLTKKLTLTKDTIKELSNAQLTQVGGAGTVITSCRPNCFSDEGQLCTSLPKGQCY
jgi:hypothetical protein